MDFAEGSDRVGHSNMLNKDGCGDYYVWSSIALGIPIGADCWSLLVVTVYVAMVCGFLGSSGLFCTTLQEINAYLTWLVDLNHGIRWG